MEVGRAVEGVAEEVLRRDLVAGVERTGREGGGGSWGEKIGDGGDGGFGGADEGFEG